MPPLYNPNRTTVLLYAQQGFTNGAAVITIAAASGHRWQPVKVFAGYDAASPTGSNLTIQWTKNGVVQTFTWYMGTAGPTQEIPLPHGGIVGDENTQIVLTLSTGGAGVAAEVAVFYGGD